MTAVGPTEVVGLSMRRCRNCGIEQPIDAFRLASKARPDGRRRLMCRSCESKAGTAWQNAHADHMKEYRQRYSRENRDAKKERDRAYRRSNQERLRQQHYQRRQEKIEQYRETARRWDAQNRDKKVAAINRWKEQNPERVALIREAGNIVQRAIRHGELTRPDRCERCGIQSHRIDAAHHDYREPLQVAWLCRPCHTQWDSREPKSIQARREDD